MARRKIFYDPRTTKNKLAYYKSLNEKQKRHFLAYEYLSLGYGSQRYLAEVFRCGRQTILSGVKEVESEDFNPQHKRIRKAGGGRKKKKMN